MTSHPYITLWKLDNKEACYKVRPGQLRRDFLDQTVKGHGYHCPVLVAPNTNGWEILLPQDITVIWDGNVTPSDSHVKILDGEFYKGRKIVGTHTGNSMVTFMFNFIIETDPDHSILMSGAPNYFFDGAIPSEVLIRSDYFHYSENFFCWKMTKPNVPVTFPKDMPIAFIRNYPNKLLQSTEIKSKDVEESQDMIDMINGYREIKKNFDSSAQPWEWSHHYKKGVTPKNKDGFEKIDKLKLMEP